MTPEEFGHSCEGGRDCTLHNLHCGYPKCEKGERDRKERRPARPAVSPPAPEPMNEYGRLKAMKDKRLAELAPRCDCGEKLTQCGDCAVGEWQALHPDCRECCPVASSVSQQEAAGEPTDATDGSANPRYNPDAAIKVWQQIAYERDDQIAALQAENQRLRTELKDEQYWRGLWETTAAAHATVMNELADEVVEAFPDVPSRLLVDMQVPWLIEQLTNARAMLEAATTRIAQLEADLDRRTLPPSGPTP